MMIIGVACYRIGFQIRWKNRNPMMGWGVTEIHVIAQDSQNRVLDQIDLDVCTDWSL